MRICVVELTTTVKSHGPNDRMMVQATQIAWRSHVSRRDIAPATLSQGKVIADGKAAMLTLRVVVGLQGRPSHGESWCQWMRPCHRAHQSGRRPAWTCRRCILSCIASREREGQPWSMHGRRLPA